jgi:hypothetical protein
MNKSGILEDYKIKHRLFYYIINNDNEIKKTIKNFSWSIKDNNTNLQEFINMLNKNDEQQPPIKGGDGNKNVNIDTNKIISDISEWVSKDDNGTNQQILEIIEHSIEKSINKSDVIKNMLNKFYEERIIPYYEKIMNNITLDDATMNKYIFVYLLKDEDINNKAISSIKEFIENKDDNVDIITIMSKHFSNLRRIGGKQSKTRKYKTSKQLKNKTRKYA